MVARKYIINNAISIVLAHLDPIIISRLATPRNVKVIATYHEMGFSAEGTYYSGWWMLGGKLMHRNPGTLGGILHVNIGASS